MSQIFNVPRFTNDWLSSESRVKPEIWYKYFYNKPDPVKDQFSQVQLPYIKRKFPSLSLLWNEK